MNLNIQELLSQQLGGGAIQQLSQQIGADEETTSNAVTAALPMLLGGLARNAQSPEGASSLLGALDRDHDGSVLDDIAGYLGQGGGAEGNGILGHVFGSNRQNVESGISQASGLDLSQVARLLPLLAPIVMAVLGRTQRQQGLDAPSLAGVLGRESQQAEASSPLMGILSQVLDSNRDGSVMDDVAGMLGGLLGGRR
ncbi:MAG: DUF937 domain-containing protein [Acidobacteriota bacterium]